ncbi:hypothetical protein, partial [Pseudomaricurvus sp.]|uniref:hypothetical protein n=1 Tax=Pseudomaricurvus sp. TaxID=2004510 RepID=UPI003F6AF112
MDNNSEKVIHQAKALWRLLAGIPLTQDQKTAIGNFIPQRGSLSSVEGMRLLLERQPRMKSLRRQWG